MDLWYLHLEKNEIKKIEGLDTLHNLTELLLSKNEIEKIEGLSMLISLEILALHENKITDIEALLPFIQKGLILHWSDDSEKENSILIKNNPLISPDIETVKLGNDAVLDYFAAKAQNITK